MDYIISSLDFREILQLSTAVFGMQPSFFLHTKNIIFCQQQPVFIPEPKPCRQLAADDSDASRSKQCALFYKSSV